MSKIILICTMRNMSSNIQIFFVFVYIYVYFPDISNSNRLCDIMYLMCDRAEGFKKN